MAYIGQSLTEGTRRVYTYTATASQSTFNAVYNVGQVDVHQNGILLQPADYTATTGTTVVLGVGAAVNDEITIIAHNTFSVADTVSASQGGTFAGAVTASNGLTVDDDGATPLTVDRATSDGTIIDVQKDATTVGSIAASGGDLLIGTGDTGIRFVDAEDTFVPFNTNGSGRDNAISIGKSSERFKDLYLSGGAYIGGTGAANYLDDYEEGTWTPSVSQGTISPDTNGNIYIKVGNRVTAWCRFHSFSDTTSANQVNITGLPFPVGVNKHNTNVGTIWGHALGGARTAFAYAGSSGTTTLNLYYSQSGTATGYDPVIHSDMNSNSNLIVRLEYHA